MDDSELEIERKKKQNYLKTEILDAGYDVGAFMEYLNTIKQDGFLKYSTFLHY